jgi:hypothetical protein
MIRGRKPLLKFLPARTSMKSTKVLTLFIALACTALVATSYPPLQEQPAAAVLDPTIISLGNDTRRLVGPVAVVLEGESGLVFRARVDTGAERCSLHVVEWEIADAAPTMLENVGKSIRFRLENRCGHSWWLEREIAEVALIRTAESEELRYMVPLRLRLRGVEREVLVSLNDRSEMRYPMLVGRNYLAGQFVVDVTNGPAHDQFLVHNR